MFLGSEALSSSTVLKNKKTKKNTKGRPRTSLPWQNAGDYMKYNEK
jgi:hypothetical protein